MAELLVASGFPMPDGSSIFGNMYEFPLGERQGQDQVASGMAVAAERLTWGDNRPWDSKPEVGFSVLVRVGETVYRIQQNRHHGCNVTEASGGVVEMYSHSKFRELILEPSWTWTGMLRRAADRLASFCDPAEWKGRETLATFLVLEGEIGGTPSRVRLMDRCGWPEDTLVWSKDTVGCRWELGLLGKNLDGRGRETTGVGDGSADDVEHAGSLAREAAMAWRDSPDRKPGTNWAVMTLDEVGNKSESGEYHNAVARFGDMARVPLRLKGSADAAGIRQRLDAEWPWAAAMNAVATGQLALARHVGKDFFRCPPLLLLGPPGIGKTRWAKRIAAIAGVGYHYQNLSANDPFVISGLSRSWKAAGPSIVAMAMHRTNSANPVVCLDEIDKTGTRGENNPKIQDVLLPMLEGSTAGHLFDDYLAGYLDGRWINWIMTANTVTGMSDLLLDRCRVLNFPPPRPEDFDRIMETALSEIAGQWHCKVADLPGVPERSLEDLRKLLARVRSIRQVVNGLTDAVGMAASGGVWTGDMALARDGKEPFGFSVR